MSDHCEVYFTPAAKREWEKVAAADPNRFAILEKLIDQVEENGWKLASNAEVIKVLRARTNVGEIRDVGSGGYRLIMFWHITDSARELWIARVLPKRDVVQTRRLNAVCDSVEKVRERFLKEIG